MASQSDDARAGHAAGQKRVRITSPAASEVAHPLQILGDDAELNRLSALVVQQASEKGVTLQQLQEAAARGMHADGHGDELKWTSQMVVLTRVLELLLHNQQLRSLQHNPDNDMTADGAAPTPLPSPATVAPKGTLRDPRPPSRLPFQFPQPPAAASNKAQQAGKPTAAVAATVAGARLAGDIHTAGGAVSAPGPGPGLSNGADYEANSSTAKIKDTVYTNCTASAAERSYSASADGSGSNAAGIGPGRGPMTASAAQGQGPGPFPDPELVRVGEAAAVNGTSTPRSEASSSTGPSVSQLGHLHFTSPKAATVMVPISSGPPGRSFASYAGHNGVSRTGHSNGRKEGVTELANSMRAYVATQAGGSQKVLEEVVTSLGDTLTDDMRARLEQLFSQSDKAGTQLASASDNQSIKAVVAEVSSAPQRTINGMAPRGPVAVSADVGLATIGAEGLSKAVSHPGSDDVEARRYSTAVEVGSPPGNTPEATTPTKGPSADGSGSLTGLQGGEGPDSVTTNQTAGLADHNLQPGVVAAAALGLPLRSALSAAQAGTATITSARSDAASRGTPVPASTPTLTCGALPSARTLARTFDDVVEEVSGPVIPGVASVRSLQELSLDSGWQDTESFAQCIRAAARPVPQPVPAWRHKSLKLVVAGAPGLGKSTLIANLLASYLDDQHARSDCQASNDWGMPPAFEPRILALGPNKGGELDSCTPTCTTRALLVKGAHNGTSVGPPPRPQQFLSHAHHMACSVCVTDAEERVKYHYTMQEGLAIEDEAGIRALEQYIQQQQDARLAAVEQVVQVDVDSNVDAVLYMLPPHRLGPYDLQAMTSLSRLVPVIPLLAKSDTMTPSELNVYRDSVMQAVREQERRSKRIIVYRFHQDVLEEAGFKFGGPPFLVMASDSFDPSLGRFAPIREYQWGIAEALRHSDVGAVKRLVFEVAYETLRAATEQRFRQHRLQRKQRGRVLGSCLAVAIGMLFFGFLPSPPAARQHTPEHAVLSSDPHKHNGDADEQSDSGVDSVTDAGRKPRGKHPIDKTETRTVASGGGTDERSGGPRTNVGGRTDVKTKTNGCNSNEHAADDESVSEQQQGWGIRRKWQSRWAANKQQGSETAVPAGSADLDVVQQATGRRERVAACVREYELARQAAMEKHSSGA